MTRSLHPLVGRKREVESIAQLLELQGLDLVIIRGEAGNDRRPGESLIVCSMCSFLETVYATSMLRLIRTGREQHDPVSHD